MDNTKPNLFNIETEQTILGMIILNNDYYAKVEELLHPEHFYEPVHQKIYEYIRDTTLKSNIVADSITLKLFFDNDETIKKIGGNEYLTKLLKISAHAVDIVDYARIVKDLAIKRQLVLVGEEIVSETHKNAHQVNAKELLETTESKLFNISEKGEISKSIISLKSTLENTMKNIKSAMEASDSISGVKTDLIDLDKLTGGFQNSDLIIVAGRPGMGKSALAVNFAYKMAKELAHQNKSVGFFSLEMPADQISMRILSMETGISNENFRNGTLAKEKYDEVIRKATEINKVPLFIDDTAALSISAIRTKTRRMVRQQNLGALVIDYLQLARGTTKYASENRVLEIGEITMGLKSIAKEFNIPVIALSQLSRLVESRTDKRPQLSDLRESGNIEQDADIVMFVYREEYYIETRKPDDSKLEELEKWRNQMEHVRNKAEIIIEKHRNGATGKIKLYFNARIGKFDNSADEKGY